MTTIRSDAAYAGLVQGAAALDRLAGPTAGVAGRPQAFADFAAFDGADARISLSAGHGASVDAGDLARQVAGLIVDI